MQGINGININGINAFRRAWVRLGINISINLVVSGAGMWYDDVLSLRTWCVSKYLSKNKLFP